MLSRVSATSTALRVPNYPVHVVMRANKYELQIPELLLTVRCKDVQTGYDELMTRMQEVIELVQLIDALDDLPSPPTGLRWP